MGFAHVIWYERRVVNSLGHITLVARQHQQMLKVEVACLEHSHKLHSHHRFAMEWDTRCAHNLTIQSHHRAAVNIQVAIVHQFQ